MKTTTRLFVQIAAGSVLAVTLSGCGGKNSNGESLGTSISNALSDKFILAVTAITAFTADDTPPVSIDGIAVTAPENTQPVPIT